MIIDISIVIVNYNVKDLLIQCLRSIYSSDNEAISIEVIVIDNDSSDDSVEAIQELFPQVILIGNKFNAGFSGANNQGIQIAQGEFIFLLNPDTEIIGNAIFQLANYIDNHSDCSIVAPQLLNSDKTLQMSAWNNHHPIDLIIETFYFHKIFQRLIYSFEEMKNTLEVKTLSGAALFFKKELIQKIGMLDESLFWMEDIDFSKRAQTFGKLIYLPSSQVIHHSGQSQKKNYNVAIANQLLSKLKYYKKHHSAPLVIIATVCTFIFIISRLIVFTILSFLKPIYLAKLRAYFYSLNKYFKFLFLNDNKLV